MSTLAKAARAAHAAAVAYKPSPGGVYSFYCCNALAHEAMRLHLWLEERNRLESLFDELFGDAAFWAGNTPEGYLRPTFELDWDAYPPAARHADRIDVLDLFATILESGDD